MLQPHIQLPDDLNIRFALLPGDPARLDAIARQLQNVEELAYNREFRSLRGTYRGLPVAALSTGIGGSSAGIAIEELRAIGVTAMIRIGSCGALQTGIGLGDLIFACGAIRDDGASKAYVDVRYPAVPDTARAAAYHLTFLGLACVFVCLMVAANGVLQAYGHPLVPVLALLCGGVLKVVTNYLMVGDPATGIRGAAVSTLYCYALIVVLNLIAIARCVPERPGYIGLFARPLLLTAVMALAARSSYGLLAQVLPERWAVLPAILIAAAVYVLLVLATGTVTRQELLALPKGEKIVQILRLR